LIAPEPLKPITVSTVEADLISLNECLSATHILPYASPIRSLIPRKRASLTAPLIKPDSLVPAIVDIVSFSRSIL
jgi:hypothetical protein